MSKKGVGREAGLSPMNCYLQKVIQENLNSSFTLLCDNIGLSPYILRGPQRIPTFAPLNSTTLLVSTISLPLLVK